MIEENLKICTLQPKFPVNIQFRDLCFDVSSGGESKLILNHISGIFNSGELSAILGPSGSGKTTLLNILAGYKYKPKTGKILINGESRNKNNFQQVCRYILQDNTIQRFLTAKESMMFAADLKLQPGITWKQKAQMVEEILEDLGLDHVAEVQTENLSGGQLKRLVIALELINNPAVLFLDEPTTGLDEVAAYQCISLLKKLAQEGRTIICSIHQPSAKLFTFFNCAYFISSGNCIYQGKTTELVPFMTSVGVECPVQFNPVDYLFELCSGEYKSLESQMTNKVDNGRKCVMSKSQITPIDKILPRFEHLPRKYVKEVRISNWSQFKYLLLRMWLVQWRNRGYILLKAVSAALLGTLIGLMYFNVAQNIKTVRFIVGFFYTCIILFMYVPMMPMLGRVPEEIKYLKREHFNKWYKLKPFFFALCCSTLPDLLIFGNTFLTITYLLTGQPGELQRILGFYLVCFVTANISEGIAIAIGTTMDLFNAMFLGPCLVIPFILFGTYGIGEFYYTIPMFYKILVHSSYLRFALEAMMVLTLGDRHLECPVTEDFCLFTDMNFYIKVMSMQGVNIWVNVVVLIVVLVLVRAVGYYLLIQRFKPNRVFQGLRSVIRKLKSMK